MNAKGNIRFGLIISLVLVGLSGCTLDNIAARQSEATGLWSELVGGETFGQSFVCTRDNLYRIDLGTATYARVNSGAVTFRLQSSTKASTDIVSITLPGPDIQNERPTSFVFPPLPDSRGKTGTTRATESYVAEATDLPKGQKQSSLYTLPLLKQIGA